MARSAPFLKREHLEEPSEFVLRDRPTVRTTAEPTPDMIRARAYEIYLERGAAPGNEVEDWVQAERDLRARGIRTGPK